MVQALREDVESLQGDVRGLFRARREKLIAQSQNDSLREHPDPVPMEMPEGMSRPPTLTELVQEHVEGAMSKWAGEQKLGTFQEEDDFEPEDEDLLPLSGFEVTEYPMEDEAPIEAKPDEKTDVKETAETAPLEAEKEGAVAPDIPPSKPPA